MVFPGDRNVAYPSISSGCPWKSMRTLFVASRSFALWDNGRGLKINLNGDHGASPSGLEVSQDIDEPLVL